MFPIQPVNSYFVVRDKRIKTGLRDIHKSLFRMDNIEGIDRNKYEIISYPPTPDRYCALPRIFKKVEKNEDEAPH